MSSDVPLGESIEALVAHKRAGGYRYESEARVLARFTSFCAAEFAGVDTVTRAAAEAWITAAQARGVKPATLQHLATPVRELARSLTRHGTDAYLLPAGVVPRPVRYVPYIYTDAELASLFAQTDRCRYCPAVPLRHLIMPVLFRLIYATGMRCSEARLLRTGDVDTHTGVVQIRDAKGGKDRQVPVAESLRTRLADYDTQAGGHPGREWFFPGASGGPLTLGNIERNFRRFLWSARIPHLGRGRGPRVHDLRHTFAVNNLRRAFTRGEDVGALLPVLQTYLGHASIGDTAYYLHLSAESYPDLCARAEHTTGDIIPAITEGTGHRH